MNARTQILTTILGALAGAVGTLSIQSVLAPSPSHAFEGAGPSALLPDPALAAALRDVATELRALREERERTAPQGAPFERVEVADPGSLAAPDVAAALRELAEAVRSRGLGTASTAAGPALVVARAGAPHAWFSSPALEDPEERRRHLTREHLFWTEQEVLDRYGPPSEIYPGDFGVIAWKYTDAEKQHGFTVQIHSGRVVRVWED